MPLLDQRTLRRTHRTIALDVNLLRRPSVSLILLLADGVRPDTLARAIDAGVLPALARLRADGGLFSVTSVFPSVTGPAYTPFLLGRHPGAVGLPGIRWYDRSHRRAGWPSFARSYVGPDLRHVDADLDPGAPTVFELAQPSIGALSVITRGLPRAAVIGGGPRFAARAALTHLRGRSDAWLGIDRSIADVAVCRIRAERPRFAFVAFTGVDKAAHAAGHDSPAALEALRLVDETAARVREDAERDGRWEATHLWVASDHGHSPVRAHDDLAGLLRAAGHRVLAHPMVFTRDPDVAVMVSGNAMAHLYLDPGRRLRPWWSALRGRWEPLASILLDRESVDLLLLPIDDRHTEVRGRGRGSAMVERIGRRLSYRPISGDPLALGELAPLDTGESLEATRDSDYPDALVQIASMAACARSGDIILSAARGWDFRARFEPIPHVSSHGGLHREHMLVPLLVNRRPVRTPERTVDTFATAAAVLSFEAGVAEGKSFL